jgi:NAD(P)H dehydrogenase (quinone)
MLRNNLYAHMQVAVIEQAIASGRVVTSSNGGATAYVTRADCAAAAAAVLTRDGHESMVYDITEPDALTAADLATLAAEIGDRDVELISLDDAGFAAGLRAAGLPGDLADLVTSFAAAARGGFLASVSSAVSDLTGRKPTALADVARALKP